MTEHAKGEAPAASTPRLVFDNSFSEDDVPLFLRKDKGEPMDEIMDPDMDPDGNAEVQEPEPEDPLADVDAPTDGGINSTEAPVSEELSIIETTVDDEETTDPGSLDEMSVEELQREQEEIARRIEQKREAEKKAVIDQIIHVVKTYKIPIEELVEALGGLKVKRRGVKAVQKYQDPKTGATWSGRGKEPLWIRGKNRDKFLIK